MQRRYLHTIELNEPTKEALERRLLSVPSPYEQDYAHFAEFCLAVSEIFWTTLPREVLQKLTSCQSYPDAPGALYIPTGVRDPVLPQTPPDGGRALDKTTFISEALTVGFGQFYGHPFGYPDEKQGERIHNIVPVPEHEYENTGSSSKGDFEAHVDNAAVSPRPDVFVLSCVRSDPRGAAQTYIADARALRAHLDEATIAALREPTFEIRTPNSFTPDSWQWVGPRPALSGPSSMPEIWLNLYNVRTLTKRAEQALDAVRHAVQCPGVAEGVCLRPGDVLIVDNRRVMHGRHPFDVKYDGEDRWLQRVYFLMDPWPWRQSGGVLWLY